MSLRAGQRLRSLREQLGLTIRDVETASLRIASKHNSEDFALSLSRLSDIETKGILPSLYRLYSMAVIYRRDIRELFDWYGVDLNATATDLSVTEPPKTHLSTVCDPPSVQVPLRLDPGFDLRKTVNFGRMVEQWGLVPLAYLAKFANTDYTYGYIGSDDYTMYPILMPGSFVQIDESVNKVTEAMWRSEYERPDLLRGDPGGVHVLLVLGAGGPTDAAAASAVAGASAHIAVSARCGRDRAGGGDGYAARCGDDWRAAVRAARAKTTELKCSGVPPSSCAGR